MTPEQRLERIAAWAADERSTARTSGRALLAAVELFSDVAPPIAAAAGVTYPADAERDVRPLVLHVLR